MLRVTALVTGCGFLIGVGGCGPANESRRTDPADERAVRPMEGAPMEWTDGTRVKVSPLSGWPDGTVGTVRPFPEYVTKLSGKADGCTRVVQGARGPLTMVWVVFDQPVRDGDGDGPYGEGEILAEYLQATTP